MLELLDEASKGKQPKSKESKKPTKVAPPATKIVFGIKDGNKASAQAVKPEKTANLSKFIYLLSIKRSDYRSRIF